MPGRIDRPFLSHEATMQLMTENSPGRFDPALMVVFERSASRFDEIYHQLTD